MKKSCKSYYLRYSNNYYYICTYDSTTKKHIIVKKLGKTSKEKAYRTLEHFKKSMSIKNIYRTINIDPPWPIEKIKRDVRPNQKVMDYKTMSLEEIGNFPLNNFISDDGCHVYLWTTHKYLPHAFDIMKKWGVNYQCLMTWVKNVGITPFSFMYSTEHVLFGTIGHLAIIRKGIRLDFKARVRAHSQKPDEFYNIIKRVSPEPRIDIFSREKREGFDCYGFETEKF